MKKSAPFLACVLVGLLLSACGSTGADVGTIATQVSASLHATQTSIPPTAVPAPVSEFTVTADGGGDFATLEQAVESVPAGSTITVGAGTYTLERRMNLVKPLHLVGAGMDQTEIVSAAEGYIVLVSGVGPFVVEDLTFRREGDARGSVVLAHADDVTFARCRFVGAVAGDLDNQAGLWIYGRSRGVVQDCVAEANEIVGFYLDGRSDVTLEGSQAVDNGSAGIAVGGAAKSVIRQNRCTGNSIGIAAFKQTESILEENVCTGNDDGILFWQSAGGVARQNQCTGNAHSGILVGERAHPTLEENTCTGNVRGGIIYMDMAEGSARRNVCSENEQVGVLVVDQARPELDQNTCNDNLLDGISFIDNAGGVASQNECVGNGQYGIVVEVTANPTIMGNDCHDNGAGDVEFLK